MSGTPFSNVNKQSMVTEDQKNIGKPYTGYNADKGVDGDESTAAHGYFWWGVDMGRPFVLTGIKIIPSHNLGQF